MSNVASKNPWILLLCRIRWTSWDISRGHVAGTSTSRAVLPLYALGHHEAAAVVQSLAIIVRCRAGDYCGGGSGRLLLRMHMLTWHRRVRALCVCRRSLHSIMLIDGLSIARIYSTGNHIVMLLLLLMLLLRMHPITAHWMRVHLLGIRVLMSRCFQGAVIPTHGRWNVLIAESIATHRLGR